MGPQEGDVLVGKYRVGRVIAQGASGLVVAARHIQLGRDVALKCLLRFPLRGPEAIPRFQQEARATATIQSEHVVRLLDVDLLPGGEPFLVLELLDGVDLKTMLTQRGRLELREVADIVVQACDAIAEAHHLNIIHRDIKPANLFLTTRADGSQLVKVLDFGLAKVGERMRLSEVATATGSVLGSALYMAPEQAKSSKDVDRRVDVWAIGTLIYAVRGVSRTHADEALRDAVKVSSSARRSCRSGSRSPRPG